ncbi:MAG: hypothetical protein ACP5PX_01035 [Candidatus Hadarchaeum sp.]|uniref:hypothetical protein n=1 Tax=Candidatus Hadarchaeum sp. TaxID=2883567 RepID=UPI003D1479E2
MREAPIYLEEDEDDFESEEDLSMEIKRSVVEFVVRRFGLYSSADIAKALNWKVREVNRVLKHLECSGRVKREKIGKTFIWMPVEERHISPMYY